MREILFKAKRIFSGEWVEGYLFETKDNSYVAYNGQFDDDLLLSPQNIFIPIDKSTICQYTGLTDKNGNKIWENDVVDASNCWWDAAGPAGHTSPIIKVEWSEWYCGFNPFACYDCDCGVYIESCDVEVIGNIFDNPELLKGE